MRVDPGLTRNNDVTLSTPGLRVVTHGEVFTRRWVVELILDLAGYRAERDLCSLVAVEPACGTGAFLVPMVERLIESARRHGRDLSEAVDAIAATDLLSANVQISRSIVTKQLASVVGSVAARRLATQWIAQADYLAETSDRQADFVLGNPPYVRQENVAAEKLEQYRALYPTMVGRADIYVAFFEKALASLVDGGVLGFISADRWMRNQYGRKLRALIGDGYSMDVNLEMHNVDAFEEQVSAYPAVTVISRRPQGSAVFANAGSGFGKPDAPQLVLRGFPRLGFACSGRTLAEQSC